MKSSIHARLRDIFADNPIRYHDAKPVSGRNSRTSDSARRILQIGNPLSLSADEDKGVKDVLKTFGGRCEYGMIFSTDDNKLWLKLSESSVLNDLMVMPKLPASGVAFTYFRNLGSEQSKYATIRSILIDSTGAEHTFDFTTDSLKIVGRYFRVLQRAADRIGSADIDGLRGNFSKNLDSAKRELLLKNLASVQSEYGTLNEVRPAGFSFYQVDGKPRLHLSGILIREKRNHPFSIDVGPAADTDSLISMNYLF